MEADYKTHPEMDNKKPIFYKSGELRTEVNLFKVWFYFS